MKHNMTFTKRFTSTACLFALALGMVSALRAAAADEAARFGWFNASKVGMFIHWGPYSVAADEWQGKRGNRDAHMQNEFRIPMAEYGQLVKEFNPVKFDADAWVRLAKDAGFGYIVYVSKHHDGLPLPLPF